MYSTTWFMIKSIILPPGILLILLFLVVLLWFFKRFFAYFLLWLTLAGFYLISTPWFAGWLAYPLQRDVLLTVNPVASHVIVILGGYNDINTPEYQGDTVSGATLVRLRYAAKLTRDSHSPILVSGGQGMGENISEAKLMSNVLKQEFNVPVQWIETQSQNTWQNAKFSSEILKQAKQTHIYLVTDAIHMKRAKWSFEQFGMEVTPAATNFVLQVSGDKFLNYVPTISAFSESTRCLYEYYGLLKYYIGKHC